MKGELSSSRRTLAQAGDGCSFKQRENNIPEVPVDLLTVSEAGEECERATFG